MSEKKSDPAIASAHEWLQQVSAELDQDPAVIRQLTGELLDLTRDVAHGPSRPAAPLTAFLVGFASGRQLQDEPTTAESVDTARGRIAQVLRMLETDTES